MSKSNYIKKYYECRKTFEITLIKLEGIINKLESEHSNIYRLLNIFRNHIKTIPTFTQEDLLEYITISEKMLNDINEEYQNIINPKTSKIDINKFYCILLLSIISSFTTFNLIYNSITIPILIIFQIFFVAFITDNIRFIRDKRYYYKNIEIRLGFIISHLSIFFTFTFLNAILFLLVIHLTQHLLLKLPI